ncbi:MAG: condensation domain-containing protein, partial [Acidobacteria bacterium]|nr:condensation domain-containing protein [Acidobacteriota bacterium]
MGIDDNFFQLGGNSLKAILLISKIHKIFAVKIPLSELFKHPRIRELAGYIKNAVPGKFEQIDLVEKKEYYKLSSAQKRLYFLQQMDKDGTAYNLSSAMIFSGLVDESKLVEVVKKLIMRHESFRTSFIVIDEEPVQRIQSTQRIHDELEFEIEELKGRGDPPWSPDIIKNFIRPFDLSCAPLLRVRLIKLKEKEYLFLVDMHHIISDGMSIQVLVQDFSKLYAGIELPEIKYQYKDYAEWQSREKLNKRIQEQGAYWTKEYQGQIPILELPLDFTRPTVQEFAGNRINFEISREISSSLKALALETGTTLYTVLLALYTIFLSKLSSGEDIVVGSPVAGSRHADLEKIIGMFVNTLALRLYPLGEKTVLDFLNEVKDIALKGFENQDYQYEDLVEQLYIKRDAGRNPLFDTLLVLQNTGSQKINIPGLKLVPYEYENKISKFDLTVIAVEADEKLQLTFEYSTALFSEATIQKYVIYFNNIMSGMLERFQAKISALEIMTGEEKKQVLYDFNITAKEYPRDKTICQLFEEQVLKSPDRISIFGHGQTRTNTDKNVEMLRNVETLRATSLHNQIIYQIQITYRQLNEQSDHLAGLLIAKGVLPDTIVGIMMKRSIDQITGLLGILKSGGAYMSIDPDYPPDRIAYMLKDSNAKVLIINKSEIRNSKFETNPNKTNSNGQNKNFGISLVLNFGHLNLNSIKGGPRRGFQHSSFSTHHLNPSTLAYIIFTSGSTGRPKGVLVTHQNVVRLVKNTNYIEFIPGESILQIGAVEFDASTFEIWGALLNGLKLILATKETILNPGKLKSFIRDFNIDIILMVSSLFNGIVQSDIEIFVGVKCLLVGGDVLSPAHIQKLRYSNPQIQIINGYGPTENTTFSTTFLIQKEYSRNIPIGKPIANSTVYIIDKYN